ncbi:hypothetical protein QQF64_032722 [Cirrhinus molitorella]|uniref:Gelsolin n=1 Tax=Cirrhinus molitorella TaxID=172907 RepID=A0ABR3MRV1_9TELE
MGAVSREFFMWTGKAQQQWTANFAEEPRFFVHLKRFDVRRFGMSFSNLLREPSSTNRPTHDSQIHYIH